MWKLIDEPLKSIHVWDEVFAKLNDLKHEIVLQSFYLCDPVKGKVEVLESVQGRKSLYNIELVLSEIKRLQIVKLLEILDYGNLVYAEI